MKQAAQVLDLLEFFGNTGHPATLTEITKQLGWPKSSAFKLLATLSARGYLYEPYGRGGYYPSPSWGLVVDAISKCEPIPDAIGSLIFSLAQRTGETAVLASISGRSALFIKSVEPENTVRYTAEVGKTVPLFATAVGRAILAQLPKSERTALLAKVDFTQFTSMTLVAADQVENAIQKGIERGYFEGQGELNDDLGGVAMPLKLPGRPLAVMIAGPRYRVTPRYAEFVRLLEESIEMLLKDLELMPLVTYRKAKR